MFALNALVLTACLLLVCEAGYVDRLQKCSIKESGCLKDLYHKVMKDIAKSGLPELDIPPLDPMELKNVSLNVLDVATLTITDGTIKGISNCVFNEFEFDIETRKAHADVSCDLLSIKGYFIFAGENPVIQSVVGGNKVNGNGKAKIKIEKFNIKFDYQIYPHKKDGEIYFKISNKDSKYIYDIGNVHFITENFIVGNNDISKILSSYFNENWKNLMKSLGSSVIVNAMEFFAGRLQQFSDSISADKYVIEDLTQYL